MPKNILNERNKKQLVTKPVLYTTTFLLIALCFVPLAQSCIPTPGIQLIKTGPIYGYAGEDITYTYRVSNTENMPLSDVTVTDDSCGPVYYVCGDKNKNGKLDQSETWTFAWFHVPRPLDQHSNRIRDMGRSDSTRHRPIHPIPVYSP
jgi:hypothetical protein